MENTIDDIKQLQDAYEVGTKKDSNNQEIGRHGKHWITEKNPKNGDKCISFYFQQNVLKVYITMSFEF